MSAGSHQIGVLIDVSLFGKVADLPGTADVEPARDVPDLIEIEVEARNQLGELTHAGRAIAVLPTRPVAVRPEVKSPYLLQHKVIG